MTDVLAHGLIGVPIAATVATGVYLLWKRPRHRVARRLLAAGLCIAAAWAFGFGLTMVYLASGNLSGFWIFNALEQTAISAFAAAWVGLFAVFPDGTYQRRYERWVVRVSAALIPAVPLLLLLTFPHLIVNTQFIWASPANATSPYYLPSLAWIGLLLNLPLFVLIAPILVALRYRRSTAEQRQQIKWPMLAAVLNAAVPVAGQLALYRLAPAWVAIVGNWILAPLLPLSVAIAILRHRLLDIDVVLRRSLVYGVLWLGIALAYLGLAAGAGIAAGQRWEVGIAVLVTIAATLLFQPARRWLETLADRLVYGERLSRYELLRQLGASLDSSFDMPDLAARVATSVRLGLGVRWSRVSLYVDQSFEAVGADGVGLDESGYAEAIVPLVHGNELLGAIECSGKLDGRFGAADEELLATLRRQAALAIRNSRLPARIVQAQEIERRRIERDIHDGVQQELVAILAKIRIARTKAAREPAAVDATLIELQEETRQALNDLRELVRGIHPPVLGDRGLVKAIEARTARLPIAVGLDPGNLDRARYSEEVEGAAYFVVSEALSNVMKHSGAEGASVRLVEADGSLVVEVSDQGRGFEGGGVQSSGLDGLRDRVEALGGRLSISSWPMGGTRVVAKLPARRSTRA
jgi:signal transduction histidine kinase